MCCMTIFLRVASVNCVIALLLFLMNILTHQAGVLQINYTRTRIQKILLTYVNNKLYYNLYTSKRMEV